MKLSYTDYHLMNGILWRMLNVVTYQFRLCKNKPYYLYLHAEIYRELTRIARMRYNDYTEWTK